jgi:hypothetical protein
MNRDQSGAAFARRKAASSLACAIGQKGSESFVVASKGRPSCRPPIPPTPIAPRIIPPVIFNLRDLNNIYNRFYTLSLVPQLIEFQQITYNLSNQTVSYTQLIDNTTTVVETDKPSELVFVSNTVYIDYNPAAPKTYVNPNLYFTTVFVYVDGTKTGPFILSQNNGFLL